MENFYMERFNGYHVYFELSVRGKGTSIYENMFHTIYDAAVAIADLWIDLKYRTSIKVGDFYAKSYRKDELYIVFLRERFIRYILFSLNNKLEVNSTKGNKSVMECSPQGLPIERLSE